jgi:hypothetical protein
MRMNSTKPTNADSIQNALEKKHQMMKPSLVKNGVFYLQKRVYTVKIESFKNTFEIH